MITKIVHEKDGPPRRHVSFTALAVGELFRLHTDQPEKVRQKHSRSSYVALDDFPWVVFDVEGFGNAVLPQTAVIRIRGELHVRDAKDQ